MSSTTAPQTARTEPVTYRWNRDEYTLTVLDAHAVCVEKAGGSTYTVDLGAYGDPESCGCQGFTWRRACRHLSMVAKMLEQGALVFPVCQGCEQPAAPAMLQRQADGRWLCPSCVDDLALHAAEEPADGPDAWEPEYDPMVKIEREEHRLERWSDEGRW